MVTGGEKAMKAQPEQVRPNNKVSVAPKVLAGVYSDPWYGTATISMPEAGKLRMRFDRTPGMEGPLVHVADGTFKVAWTDRTIEAAYVKVTTAGGKVAKFEMRPVSPLADFSFDYQDLYFERSH